MIYLLSYELPQGNGIGLHFGKTKKQAIEGLPGKRDLYRLRPWLHELPLDPRKLFADSSGTKCPEYHKKLVRQAQVLREKGMGVDLIAAARKQAEKTE